MNTEDDHLRSGDQVETGVSGLQTHKEHLDVWVVLEVHEGLIAFRRGHSSIVPAVADALPRNRNLEEIEKRGKLAEHNGLLLRAVDANILDDFHTLRDFGTVDPALLQVLVVY